MFSVGGLGLTNGVTMIGMMQVRQRYGKVTSDLFLILKEKKERLLLESFQLRRFMDKPWSGKGKVTRPTLPYLPTYGIFQVTSGMVFYRVPSMTSIFLF